jgi:hypothetical protein
LGDVRRASAVPVDGVLTRRRPADGERPAPAGLSALHRTVGNRALARAAVLARAGAATAAPAAWEVRRKEVDREITETISHAPARYSAWEGTYRWRARWRLKLDGRGERAELDVKVRLHSTASAAVKRAWAAAIRRKWSGRFAFAVLRDAPVALPGGGTDDLAEMYPIWITIEWVDDPAKAHYTITGNAAGATEHGRAGVGGTTSMTGWGIGDTQDITHEFGHILGCPEEYFTTNGVDHTHGGRRQGFRDAGGGIMNNPAGPALARNFDVIRREAAALRGVAVRRTRIVPWR